MIRNIPEFTEGMHRRRRIRLPVEPKRVEPEHDHARAHDFTRLRNRPEGHRQPRY